MKQLGSATLVLLLVLSLALVAGAIMRESSPAMRAARADVAQANAARAWSQANAAAAWATAQAANAPARSALLLTFFTGLAAVALAAAAGLSRATVLVHPTAAHGVAFQDTCVNDIIASFLDNPTGTPDSNCLTLARPLDFVPPDAVTFPPMAGVNSLKPRTLAVFGLAAVLVVLLASAFIVWPIAYIVRAFGDRRVTRTPADRRLRWLSRGLMLVFAAVAVVFGLGLLVAIVASLASLTMATALSLPSTAAPLLWLPLPLLVLAVAIVIATILLWRRRDSGSTLGKVYYTVLALCAVVLVILIAGQGVLLPPL